MTDLLGSCTAPHPETPQLSGYGTAPINCQARSEAEQERPDAPRMQDQMHPADASPASGVRFGPVRYRAYIDCPQCLESFMASWSSARDEEATVCPRCGHTFSSAFPGFIFLEPLVIKQRGEGEPPLSERPAPCSE